MTALPASPAEAVIATVPNPHPGTLYAARFTCPEFTALCPLSGQPDFAQLLVAAAAPQWLRISGYWYPRGGIPIDVFFQTGPPPEGLFLPEPGVAPYRGRG